MDVPIFREYVTHPRGWNDCLLCNRASRLENDRLVFAVAWWTREKMTERKTGIEWKEYTTLPWKKVLSSVTESFSWNFLDHCMVELSSLVSCETTSTLVAKKWQFFYILETSDRNLSLFTNWIISRRTRRICKFLTFCDIWRLDWLLFKYFLAINWVDGIIELSRKDWCHSLVI